ncbi:hypothetical protein LUZ60_001728 [Juncus effusus]|nr:hypothetical protein LUZ60_001728 [Juncus effusus]
MSAKDCGNHGYWRVRKFYRRLFSCLFCILFLAGLVILLIWLILRPTKPTFALQSLSILNLTLSNSQTYNLTTLVVTLQLTLASRNPNSHIGVYYGHLDSFASYRSQMITAPTILPSVYLISGDSVVWSPFVSTPSGGAALAPPLGTALLEDQTAGQLLLHVEVTGTLKWKVGTLVTGSYHLHANCPALLTRGNNNNNNNNNDTSFSAFRFGQVVSCTVDI